MPRKSAAAVEADIFLTHWAPKPSPPAPSELTPSQAKIWDATVACRPPEWFDGAAEQLLVAYCRHCDTANVIAAAINELDPNDQIQFYRYVRLLPMADRESKTIAMLASKLRLAPLNTRRIEHKVPTPQKSPWGECNEW